jgi:hypothetical protein
MRLSKWEVFWCSCFGVLVWFSSPHHVGIFANPGYEIGQLIGSIVAAVVLLLLVKLAWRILLFLAKLSWKSLKHLIAQIKSKGMNAMPIALPLAGVASAPPVQPRVSNMQGAQLESAVHFENGRQTWNFKEGTRRLALLLGVAGAIYGGFLSYGELQSIAEQRASYIKFEQLTSSPVAEQAQNSIRLACTQDPTDKQCGDDRYPPMSEVNSGGIKTIYWSKDYKVQLFQMDDGQNLFPTAAPAAWDYLLVVLLPVIGFLIPWGAVRAIGWVLAGFIHSSK